MISAEDYLGHIKCLNEWTKAYDEGHPMVSDKQWDDWYFEVQEYEREYPELIIAESPTQTIHFETVSELKKVKHNHPMLSLNKTKDIEEVRSFVGDKDSIVMAKMDGLTCSLHYEGGKLVSAETRGNGEVGEDITHNAMVIPSVPKRIIYKDSITIDGEIICTYENFENWADEYKNPRNFASGSIRLLDSKECRKRGLTFVAWDIIEPKDTLHLFRTLGEKLNCLHIYGFEVVPNLYCNYNDFETILEFIRERAEERSYPIDGAVIKYNRVNEYEAAGRTDHHFKGGLAYKFYDETYETRLIDILWSMGRTGQISPIALFEKINIDGTEISKASLSNISVMKQTLGTKPFKGQIIYVSKRNQIIPKIEKAKDENGEWI